MQKLQSFVQQGDTTLVISGAAGTIARVVQGSFPSATITVYLAGTLNLAGIYSDNSGTTKANPFTASSDGTWFFYAPNGRYDVKFSGGGIAAPFTLGDFSLFDESSMWADVTAAQFGAQGNGIADDSTAINAAITSLTNGGIVFFPPGNYRINSTINVAANITFLGVGAQASIIQANGTDAFTIAVVNSFQNISLVNLGINGTNCTTKYAITQPSLVSSANQLYGFRVEGCYITNFNQGINATNISDAWIINNYIQDVDSGIIMLGQNLRWNINGNRLVYGSGCGSGNKDGIKLGYATFTSGGLIKPEGARVDTNLFFGFNTGINCDAVTGCVFVNNDIAALVIGIRFSEAVSVNFDGNYVEVDGATATQGMLGVQQSAINTTKINIVNNTFITNGSTTGCPGLQLDTNGTGNQAHIRIEGNEFSTFSSYDIVLYGAGNIDVISNECFSTGVGTSLYIPSSLTGRGITVDRNFFAGTINAPFGSQLAQIIVGTNWGTFSTFVRGRSVITNPATSVTTTYASLLGAGAIPDFDTTAHTGFKLVGEVIAIDDRTVGVTVIQSPAAVNQVVINCTTTPASTVVVDWEVRMIQRFV